MIEPYLNLCGKADEAIAFYQTVFACSEPHVLHVGEMPGMPAPEELHGRVAFAKMTIEGTVFNFSDMQPKVQDDGKISLMVQFDGAQKVEAAYEKILAGGGFALMEIGPQPFAKSFAWVRDRFGIDWQLIFER